MQLMEERHQQNPERNILLSEECTHQDKRMLHNVDVYDFLQETVFQNYTLEVIVTYRRLEDWYPSARRQIIKRQQDRKYVGVLQPLFPTALHQAQKQTHVPYPTTPQIVRTMNTRSKIKLHVLNFHQGGGILSNFACDILNAPRTCASSSSSSTSSQDDNNNNNNNNNNVRLNEAQFDSLLYDEIVSYGASRGFFNASKVHRPDAIRLAQEYHNNRNDENYLNRLPLVCPTQDVLREYLNVSLLVEREMVPNFVTPDVERDHVDAFWKSTSKYCSINTTAIEEGPYWRNFFRHIGTI
jgi:hypothetical protein